MISTRQDKVSGIKTHDPFGMLLVGRNWEGGSEYRFGFNGKESDKETYGDGNIYDYGFRIYNPRLGKFLSVDPLFKEYVWYTPYQFAGNKPIIAIDIDGREDSIVITLQYYKNGALINTKTVRQKLTEQGPHGDGNTFMRIQFTQENEAVRVKITSEYFEKNNNGDYLDNYKNIGDADPFYTTVDNAKKLWMEYVKPKENAEYMTVLEEWAISNIDQTELIKLAEIFGDPRGNWAPPIDEEFGKSRGLFNKNEFTGDTGIYIYDTGTSPNKAIGGPDGDTVVGVKSKRGGYLPIREATNGDKDTLPVHKNYNDEE